VHEVNARLAQRLRLPVYADRGQALLTDLYQLTMMSGYFRAGLSGQHGVFDVFYRQNPPDCGYVVCAGLEQVVIYLATLRFSEDELAFVHSLGTFDAAFIDALRTFRFTGSVHAVPEGTVVFPNEPLLRVEGPMFELQLIESALLCFINHQSLIATKAARIVQAAGAGAPVAEFGLRRAQNADAAVFGARAAYIGGCASTSNVAAARNFGIPLSGTQAHSWIQMFPNERAAFAAYAAAVPGDPTLLVDTYDALASGVPQAIETGRELRAQGRDLAAIRIDSGDLAYVSKGARRALDGAGFAAVRIVASDDLDEETIRDLRLQGAPIDAWGVGTSLITSKASPALGGVYKLAAVKIGDRYEPRIKVSENPAKITNPGKKKVVRFYVNGLANADLILLADEPLPAGEPVLLFDPVHTYRRKTLTRYTVRELLEPVFIDGQLVYELPDTVTIRQACAQEIATLSEETRRLKNPHIHHVDLSSALWELRRQMVASVRPH
jgi:nicotinate phosphoribosyltransferase